MKKGIILLGLASLLLMANGCKKSSSSSLSVEGAWELRKVNAMLPVSYPAGNGRIIKFQGDHYEMSENGQVTESGSFDITYDPSVSESTCLVIPEVNIPGV